MFEHHQKLLSDESHSSKTPPGAGVKMLTFDEQLRLINIDSKKKSASVNGSLTKDEVWKNTMEKSFWKKIKSRYEKGNKKKENTNVVDRIVVLKPIDQVARCPVDIGCRCLQLHPHQTSKSKQHIVKHTHVSFDDVRKKLKHSKKLKSLRKMESCTETGSRTENISLVSYSKHQEPDFFMEARKHLAERLMLVAMDAGLGASAGEPLGSSCKQQVSRTLDRILLSSPIHESMADFGHEPESGLSPFKQHGNSTATGFVKITGSDGFLSRGSKLSNMGSGPSPSGTDGSFEGPEMELLLDVSSPKAGCKPENMDNDRLRENPSPVSVLDSLFSDSISSPTSPIGSVELHIQPRRLSFEELLSQASPPQRETSLRSFSEDPGFISSYVKEIYQIAQSNWEEYLATDHPLQSSSGEHKVLHDYVKEVLVSLHSRTALFSSRVQPFSLEKDVINRVIDQVDWHNGQPMGPRTLDHLFRRDIAKHEPWLDTLSNRNDIVVEVADETLHELVIEAIHDLCV